MRAILPACTRCKLNPKGLEMPGCPHCGGFRVMMDCQVNPKDRQMIDAWRDEPAWHRTLRWQAEAAGRPGFFQSRPTIEVVR